MPLFKNQPATPLASSDAKGEAISQPYRFELELISENAELDLQSLLHQRSFLAFTPDGLGIHGKTGSSLAFCLNQRLIDQHH